MTISNRHSFGSKISYFLESKIKKIDKFGFPVSLTYKREVTYQSAFGGIMTILSTLAVIAFFSLQLDKAINHKHFTINNTNYVKDLYLDHWDVVFSLSDFDYAVTLVYRGTNTTIMS